MKYPVLLAPLAMTLAFTASSPVAAQFFYDPDGPPLVSYSRPQARLQPVVRFPDGRRVTVPAWSVQGWRHRDEPPVPASQYSLN